MNRLTSSKADAQLFNVAMDGEGIIVFVF
ncbi:unnamed protein product, partial [Rotaria magnacalcarata]